MEFLQLLKAITVVQLQKLKPNNLNLDLVDINASAFFGRIPSIHSQDIERKQNSDDNQGT